MAILTKQKDPDNFINVCDQFFPDDKNKKTTLVTIDNREQKEEYNKLCIVILRSRFKEI